jgi:hypothetical protein
VKRNTYGDWRRRRPPGEENSVEAPPAEDDQAPAAVVRAAEGTQDQTHRGKGRVGARCEQKSTGAHLGRRRSVFFFWRSGLCSIEKVYSRHLDASGLYGIVQSVNQCDMWAPCGYPRCTCTHIG